MKFLLLPAKLFEH